MRLEPVIVGGVAGRTFRSREFEQLADLGGRTEQRFFHQRVFSIGQKVPENREFFLIGNAHAGRVVRPERHILDSLKINPGCDRIDDGYDVLPGNRATFASLHAETDDRYSHSKRERFSSALSFFRTSSGFTGLLPSCSQATAAASAPRIEPITFDFVATMESVA